jgi:excisionase family DNA binding protein
MTRTDEHPSPPGESDRRVVGYEGAENHTGIRRNTLYNLVSQGRIPHIRLGPRFVLFDLDDLDEWLAARKVAAKDAAGTTRRST